MANELIDVLKTTKLGFASGLRTISSIWKSSYYSANTGQDIDIRFIKEKYWMVNDWGSLVNTFMFIYTDDYENDPKNFPDDIILIFGVSISLSKSPKIIQTNVKGMKSPVFQSYSNDSFDFTVNFIESGPTFFLQNSKQIEKLVNILDKSQTLNILNPQLDITYKINKAIVKSYNISQHQTYYNQTPISIKFKSDMSEDIFSINETT